MAEGEAEMSLSLHAQDIVRVHPGVLVDGRDCSGVLLTVVAATAADLDGTQSTGDRPIHLGLADVDLVHHFGGIR